MLDTPVLFIVPPTDYTRWSQCEVCGHWVEYTDSELEMFRQNNWPHLCAGCELEMMVEMEEEKM